MTLADLWAMEDAEEVIRLLKRGSCWCEMAIGNPMFKEHSEACQKAQAYEKKWGLSE